MLEELPGHGLWYPLSAMSAVCDICGKKPGFGNNISHSHRRTRRRWNPNVHKMRALVNGAPKRVSVCTKCLKANKVTRAG
jgi:large subunit ribosomal protein L28